MTFAGQGLKAPRVALRFVPCPNPLLGPIVRRLGRMPYRRAGFRITAMAFVGGMSWKPVLEDDEGEGDEEEEVEV